MTSVLATLSHFADLAASQNKPAAMEVGTEEEYAGTKAGSDSPTNDQLTGSDDEEYGATTKFESSAIDARDSDDEYLGASQRECT